MQKRSLLERNSWIAGIVSAILAIVGFGYSVFSGKSESGVGQINVNSGSGTAVGVVNGSITINQHSSDYPKEVLEINGRWDDKKVNKIVRQSLIAAEPRLKEELCLSGSVESCKIEYAEIGKYSLIYNGKEVVLLLWAAIEDSEFPCHGCMPYISIFEFERRPNGWKLTQSDVGVFQWGSWGGMDAASVVARPIGPGTYGIVFDIGVSQGGFSETDTAIWAKLGDSYRKILHICSEVTDSGTMRPGRTSWGSVIKYVKSDVGLYPIEIETKGKIDGKLVKTISRLEFNGVEYRGVNLPSHVGPIDCIKRDHLDRCT